MSGVLEQIRELTDDQLVETAAVLKGKGTDIERFVLEAIRREQELRKTGKDQR